MTEICDDPSCQTCRPDDRPLSPFLQKLVDGIAGGDPAAHGQLTEDVRRARADVHAVVDAPGPRRG